MKLYEVLENLNKNDLYGIKNIDLLGHHKQFSTKANKYDFIPKHATIKNRNDWLTDPNFDPLKDFKERGIPVPQFVTAKKMNIIGRFIRAIRIFGHKMKDHKNECFDYLELYHFK